MHFMGGRIGRDAAASKARKAFREHKQDEA